MRIAVLSRGPSFSKTWAKVDPNRLGRRDALIAEMYQEVIGLNDVPTEIPVDWWVFRDWVSLDNWIADIKPLGTKDSKGTGNFPGIYTGQHVIEDLAIRRLFHHCERMAIMRKSERIIYDWELSIPLGFPPGPNPNKWNSWSGTAALGFAFCRMQRYRTPHDQELHIDVYGVDLAGTSDSFGNVNTTRIPDRWERESLTWGAMVKAIEKAGIRVNRIKPADNA